MQKALDDEKQQLLEKLRLLEQQLAQQRESQGSSTPNEPKYALTHEASHKNDEKTQNDFHKHLSVVEENCVKHSEAPPSLFENSNFTINDVAEPQFPTYKKLGGTVDYGREFEQLMCGLYALKLSTDDSVVDFEMTTNNKENGIFDDIGIKVTFSDKQTRTFLLQLKHKESEKNITKQDLLNRKKDFGVEKYFESLNEIKTNNCLYILYTNSTLLFENKMQLSDTIVVEQCTNMPCENFLLNTNASNTIFQIKKSLASDEFETFYLLTKQRNIRAIKYILKEMLQDILKCDIWGSFTNFMSEWWSQRFVLTRHDFISKLTELALSPYIKTLSDSKFSQKSESLRQIIMEFPMTIVADVGNIVENIWKIQEEISQKDICAKKFKLDTNDLSRILWHLDKVPLIVKVDDSNKETVIHVMKFFKRSVNNKKIILEGKVTKEDFENWQIFANLSNIIKKKFGCDDILRNFRVSFQGRDSISLELLLKIDADFFTIITTKELLQMSQIHHLTIVDSREEMLCFHQRRTISSLFISNNNIVDYYSSAQDIVIVISCDQISKNHFVQRLQVNFQDLSEYLDNVTQVDKDTLFLFSVNNKCTTVQFDTICKKSKKSNVYLLQQYDETGCILLMSKGALPPSKYTKHKKIMKEEVNKTAATHVVLSNYSKNCNFFDNDLNVICAPPGMGKSTLINVLFNNCPQEYWAVSINLIKYNSFFAKKTTFEEIMGCFLSQDKEENDLLKSIKKICWKNRKIILFLDGLDEVKSDFVDFVMDFAKHMAVEGIKVWISSRENLREKIYQFLCIIPIEIQELEKNQQEEYIQEKLKNSYEDMELDVILTAIFRSADLNNSRSLLGVPLQLHIITEIFLYNKQAYQNLKEKYFFVLTHMYKLFFEGKKSFGFKKVGIDENMEHQLGLNFADQLEKYEILGLKSCLEMTEFSQFTLDENKTKAFVVQLKSDGDKYGIIKAVTDGDEAIFDHQTYAEYFACAWLKKNAGQIAILKRELFSEKYNNLRLMFDIMMGENNPLHLAVIYKSIDYFEKHLTDIDSEDDGGRTVLHLACSYGITYPRASIHGKYYFAPSDIPKREETWYKDMMRKLILETGIDVEKEDDIFKFSSICYALASGCLYPIEMILKKDVSTFLFFKPLIFEYFDEDVLLYYAALFGYPNLMSVLIKDNPQLVNKEIFGTSLLRIAVIGHSSDICTIPREGNIAVAQILIKHEAEINSHSKYATVLDDACTGKCYDMLKMLIDNGADCTEGNTVLHKLASNYSKYNEEIAKCNIDVNIRNQYGQTALQVACESANLEFVQELLKRESNVNNLDNYERNALHYAIEPAVTPKSTLLRLQPNADENLEKMNKMFPAVLTDTHDEDKYFPFKDDLNQIISLLVKHGININAQDINGTTPLHFACRNSSLEIVKLLVKNNGIIHILDNSKQNALHYACSSFWNNRKTLNFLIEQGLNVNAQDTAGHTPLHHLCECSHIFKIKDLLKADADTNILDNLDNSCLHYASFSSSSENEAKINLLISKGLNINSRNGSGQTPLHVASHVYNLRNIETFLTLGANINAVDNEGNNALHYVSKSGRKNIDLISPLISYGIDINAQNNNGTTALHMACEDNHLENVSKLLEKGAQTNVLDNDKSNALHYAMKLPHRNEPLINLLVTNGVDVNVQNKSGITPLHLAYRNRDFPAGVKLFEGGIQEDALDTTGTTDFFGFVNICKRKLKARHEASAK